MLKKQRIRPFKSRGQNFLIHQGVLRKIVDAAEIHSQDNILEIGPGLGILTLELAKKANQVIAVENDQKLSQLLLKILNNENIKNVKIVNEDILNYQSKLKNYKLVANPPYYITSPIIRKFLKAKHLPQLIVLTVQKEIAHRINAQPPNMNILAIAVQIYAQAEIISSVPKSCFWPTPKVDSAIIRIKPKKKKQLPHIDPEKLLALVKTGFSSKRKMLKNNLQIKKSVLEKIKINPKARAENLSINQWIKLCKYLHE